MLRNAKNIAIKQQIVDSFSSTLIYNVCCINPVTNDEDPNTKERRIKKQSHECQVRYQPYYFIVTVVLSNIITLDYLQIIWFFLPPDCSCSSFVNKNGFGKCLKDYKHKGPICYVNEPSNCKDLFGSTDSNEHQYSWTACENECKS